MGTTKLSLCHFPVAMAKLKLQHKQKRKAKKGKRRFKKHLKSDKCTFSKVTSSCPAQPSLENIARQTGRSPESLLTGLKDYAGWQERTTISNRSSTSSFEDPVDETRSRKPSIPEITSRKLSARSNLKRLLANHHSWAQAEILMFHMARRLKM